MDIQSFLKCFRSEKVRRNGSQWSTPCPAHADVHQSLSIKEADNGLTLIKCFAGRTAEAS